MSGPAIESGTLVIRGGRIAAVGGTVTAPDGARVIDAGGKTVTPGLLDSAVQIGIVEIPLSAEGTADQSTTDARVSAAFNGRGRVQRQLDRDPGHARRRHHARAHHARRHRQRVPRPGRGDRFQRRAGAGKRHPRAGRDGRAAGRGGRRRRRRLALDGHAAAARDPARRAGLRDQQGGLQHRARDATTRADGSISKRCSRS